MANRGVSGAPVTIHIQAPDGSEYSSVSGNSLIDIPVSTASYSTGPIWSTGSYTSGTYTIWAECNANSMNDNYGAVGKSQSAQKQMLLQSINPLITSSVSPSLSISTGWRYYPSGNAGPDNRPGHDSPADYFCTGYYHSDTTTHQFPCLFHRVTTNAPPHKTTTVPGPGIVLILIGVLRLHSSLCRRPGTLNFFVSGIF